jgi:hypothetical protein
MRLYATTILEKVLQNDHNTFWAIRALCAQLYDPAEEVSTLALCILATSIKQDDFLTKFLSIHPNLDFLSIKANHVLLQLLNVPQGYQQLLQSEILDEEIDFWFDGGVFQYVPKVEILLADSDLSKNFNKTDYPTHLYGHLPRTADGAALLKRLGHFEVFVSVLTDFEDRQNDSDGILQLKASIWALCHMGTTKHGSEMLREQNVFEALVLIAKTSSNLSLRATCINAFQLLGRGEISKSIMNQLGWSHNNGILLPDKVSDYLQVEIEDYVGSWPANYQLTPIPTNFDQQQVEILEKIGSLSNHILSSNAFKSLAE